MQTIIKLNENKSLTRTSNLNIYEGENMADSLLFLFPQTYGEYDFVDLSVSLHWFNENEEGDVYLLDFEEEPYREEYTCSIVDITEVFTAVVGKITMWLEVSNNDGLLMKSDEISLIVKKHSDSVEYTPEATPQIFTEYKAQMEQLINSASIILDSIIEAESRIDEKIDLMLSAMEEWEARYGNQ